MRGRGPPFRAGWTSGSNAEHVRRLSNTRQLSHGGAHLLMRARTDAYCKETRLHRTFRQVFSPRRPPVAPDRYSPGRTPHYTGLRRVGVESSPAAGPRSIGASALESKHADCAHE